MAIETTARAVIWRPQGFERREAEIGSMLKSMARIEDIGHMILGMDGIRDMLKDKEYMETALSSRQLLSSVMETNGNRIHLVNILANSFSMDALRLFEFARRDAGYIRMLELEDHYGTPAGAHMIRRLREGTEQTRIQMEVSPGILAAIRAPREFEAGKVDSRISSAIKDHPYIYEMLC